MLPWLLGFAVLVVLPVVLRLRVGDDAPRNEIIHEQPGDGEHDPGPAAVPALA